MAGNLVLLGVLSTWLTPFWLVTLGITLGLLILAVLFGIVWAISRPAGNEIIAAVTEGPLQILVYLGLFLAAFTLIASVQMPISRFIDSISRVSKVGTVVEEFKVPAETERFPLPISFRGEELVSYQIESEQDLVLGAKIADDVIDSIAEIQGRVTTEWRKRASADLPFPGAVSELYFSNYSRAPANVTLTLQTEVEVPQVYSVPITALAVISIFLFYLVFHFCLPKVSAIAATTAKQGINQPVFYLALALGLFLLLAFIYIPYYTFGEDVKMLKHGALATILILAILVALWTASVSVADEIDGRTALTVLSKPVSRFDFILGKYLGIVWPILILFVVLGLFCLLTVSYKVVYDARESALQPPEWQQCYFEMIRVVPGLVLGFMETIVLASISVAISTRLPMLANLVICGTVYVLGHLVPLIVESRAAQFPIVRFVGKLIATILPTLEYFKIEAAIDAGVGTPPAYLAWMTLYCLLYSVIAMLLALTLFEDRDLA